MFWLFVAAVILYLLYKNETISIKFPKIGNARNSKNRYPEIQTSNEPQISDDKVENAERFHFIAQKLMNNEEEALYKKLVAFFIKEKLFQENKFKLQCQVGMGGFITPPDQDGFKSSVIFGKTIGALRVDYLVVDERNNPVIVIEYHGKGHYKGNWKVNDKVKEILCKKVGIKLVIIKPETDLDITFTEISNHLAWHYQSLKRY